MRASNRAGDDFRAKGMIKLAAGKHYLQFSGTGQYWILNDLLNTHDFRPYEALWGDTRHARNFMDQIPFADMTPSHQLLRGEAKYTLPMYDIEGVVLAKPGEVYSIYLPDGSSDGNRGGPPELDLRDYDGLSCELNWYNPRNGKFVREAERLEGGDWGSVGYTQSGIRNTDDWAAIVTKVSVGAKDVNLDSRDRLRRILPWIVKRGRNHLSKGSNHE